MRNKLLLTVFSVVAVLAIAVSPVYAITGNFVEDNQHPYVGLVVFTMPMAISSGVVQAR